MTTEHDRSDQDLTALGAADGVTQEELAEQVAIDQSQISRLERQGDYGGDEEKTLPPPPPYEPAGPAGLERPSGRGDFKTHETTFAALGGGDVVEVQLISERGAHAHFAMDRQLAGHVANDLERQLSESSYLERRLSKSTYHDRFLLSPPPKLGELALPGTDVFFTLDEAPTVKVKQETGGDRIVLSIRSEEASLRITMQGGVAVALWRFLARAAGRRRSPSANGGLSEMI
jgi:hypothetical protein